MKRAAPAIAIALLAATIAACGSDDNDTAAKTVTVTQTAPATDPPSELTEEDDAAAEVEAARDELAISRDNVIWSRARVRIARYCVATLDGTASDAVIKAHLKAIDTLTRLYREDPDIEVSTGTRRQELVDVAGELDGCDPDGAREIERVLELG